MSDDQVMRKESRPKAKVVRRIETWPLSKLKPHAMQAKVFNESSPQEIQQLANDIKKNGLVVPIEALRDGTIICGHQRLRALQLLKRTNVSVWVRDDLEHAGPAAVTQRLIEDNLNRRQLGPIAKARAFRELKKVSLDLDASYAAYPNVDRRDALADQLQFKKSGKTLERLEKLLKLPRVLQDAVDEGDLPITKGLRLVNRPRQEQLALAKRVNEIKAACKGSSRESRVELKQQLKRLLSETFAQTDETEQQERAERPRSRTITEQEVRKGLRAMRELEKLKVKAISEKFMQELKVATPELKRLMSCQTY